MAVQFVPPVGLHPHEPLQELAEGYELSWHDSDPPHYCFRAQVSTLRLERLFSAALRCLPEVGHAVLEVRRSDEELDADPTLPEHRRWVSGPVLRMEVEDVFRRYAFQLVHDGMVGFGMYDPDSALEVFLDDHKLLDLLAPSVEPFEQLFERFHVPHRERLETVIGMDHEHHTLAAVPDRVQVPREGWLRRRRFDVRRFTEFIRARLGMRLEPHPAE